MESHLENTFDNIDLDENTKKSLMRMEEEEERAGNTYGWILLAREWKHIEENARARSCMLKAENKAQRFYDWLNLAEAWLEIFDDNPQASICLIKAENKAEDVSEWSQCAQMWEKKLHDNTEAKRCKLKADEKDKAFRITLEELDDMFRVE
jgi:hypothetical protein